VTAAKGLRHVFTWYGLEIDSSQGSSTVSPSIALLIGGFIAAESHNDADSVSREVCFVSDFKLFSSISSCVHTLLYAFSSQSAEQKGNEEGLGFRSRVQQISLSLCEMVVLMSSAVITKWCSMMRHTEYQRIHEIYYDSIFNRDWSYYTSNFENRSEISFPLWSLFALLSSSSGRPCTTNLKSSTKDHFNQLKNPYIDKARDWAFWTMFLIVRPNHQIQIKSSIITSFIFRTVERILSQVKYFRTQHHFCVSLNIRVSDLISCKFKELFPDHTSTVDVKLRISDS
jgi:hypothetical protein